MGRILFFLVALIAAAAAVLIFAPDIIPAATYKDRVETAASGALGREVTIGDNISFRIFPHTAFHVEDLQIANTGGFEGDYLARVGEADIGVKLFTLLSGAVEVDRFVLTEPDIVLARKKDGAINWNLAREAATDNTGAGGRAMRDLRLGDVRIIDGKARYDDAAAGRHYVIEDMDLTLVLKSLSEPFEAKGTMVFQGAPSTIDLVLTNLADMMAAKPSNLKLDLQIGEAAAGADVTVETAEALHYSGPVRLNAPDLPAFAALVGTKLADAPGFDRLSFSGDVDGGGAALRLSNAKIDFDEIAAQGAVTLDWSGARPKASGVLSTDKLDLRPYMPPPVENAQGFPAWSKAKMDFTSLRNIDAVFDISTNAILINDLEFGESRLKLNISNGRMTADIPELSMYDGQGSGQVVVNARGGAPSFSGNFDMGAVQAEPFSRDLFKNDNLLGLGSFKLNFTASGASQAAIMSSMDGRGGFDLTDGALKGVNIAKIARAVAKFQDGFNPAALQNAVAAARGPNEATDFSEFLSDFTITNGLVNAPKISMIGPYLVMTGNGGVNLPAQTIDIRLSPRATTTIDGKGGRAAAIPIRIGGTFSKPTIGVDAESLLRGGAERTVRGLLDNIGKKDEAAPPDANGANDNAAPPAEEEEPSPEETAIKALEGLFGGGKKDDEN